MRAWKEGLNFRELILADQEVTGRVPRKQIELAFDLQRQLRNIDKIFSRVFGAKKPKENLAEVLLGNSLYPGRIGHVCFQEPSRLRRW